MKVRAMVDTGAMRTCVPASLVEALGPDLDWHYIRASGPLGPVTRARVVRLNLRVNNARFDDLDCVVLTERSEALLGWDVLSNADVFAAAPSQPLITNLALMLEHVSSFKQKFVLVIGQDTSEMARLRSIQSALVKQSYEGLVVKDISSTGIQCLEEKVNMLGSLCRFVICENTTPSGHIAELQICTRNRFVTAILQQTGHCATQMLVDYGVDFAFVKTFEYASTPHIHECVDRAVRWANGTLDDRAKYLKSVYRTWESRRHIA
jgi:hypothetical protein